MKPIRLSLNNFQSHRSTDLDLGQIACAVLSGANGAGKSSIIDGIRFALFGYARGGNLDTVVTEGTEVCRVEFEFMLGDEHYLISRQRSRKGNGSTTLSFQRMGEPWEGGRPATVLDGKTATDTQRKIEDLLHMTDALFTQTACANQGNSAAFSQAKPAERKQVLGEILDLGVWEQRASNARYLCQKLEMERDSKTATISNLEEEAARQPIIEAEIAAIAAEVKACAGTTTLRLTDQAEHENAREGLVTQRAEDQARRRELTELESRAVTLTDARAAAEKRLHDCQQQTIGKAGVLDLIKGSEAAQVEANDLEAKRQERERLTNEAKPLAEQIKAAQAEHAAAIRQLETQIASAKRHRDQQLKTLDGTLAELHKQATVLGSVPCVLQEAKLLAESCPLIAQAREAEQRIPDLERERAEIAEQAPWADDEHRLEVLRQETPAADLIAERDKLKAQYDAISYDADAHTDAKMIASNLPGHQRALAQIEAAEAQLPALRESLEQSEADTKQISERVTMLTAELGEPRDWKSVIASVDWKIANAKDELSKLQRTINEHTQRQGVLSEQLRLAQEAGEKAKALREDIAALEKRVMLLKLLGNTQSGAFSKNGIPALLIERAVPELEASANEVLETLSDGRMALQLRTQKESSGKGMSETLDVIVSDEHGERLYESFSGGECMRVDLALRVGLSTLMAQRAGARCELLVLDEACAPLDQRGQEQFVEAINKISGRFGTVLVVSHLESLKDQFPVRIEVSKNGDGSKVEVVG